MLPAIAVADFVIMSPLTIDNDDMEVLEKADDGLIGTVLALDCFAYI